MKAKRGRGPRGGHGGSGSDLQKDLQLIQSDPRFAHVASDPKYRHIPKKERKVKLDSRFHSILTDEKFYEKSTMDPRGRKGNYSTKEDLLRFYHMSSDEDSEKEEEDGDDEEEEEEEEEEEDDDEDKEDEKEKEEDDDEEEEEKEEKIESSREEGNENLYISIDRKGKRDKGLKKERKPEEESEKGKKEEKKKTKKEKGKKSITEQETTEREEDDGDEDNKEQEKDDTSKRDEEERSQVTPEVRSRLKDLTRDYARGGGDLFSSDSSDDDSTTTDEEEEEAEEFEWAELDQDAVWDNEAEVEETSRIAICNLDWDRIKAADLMVLFSSFCPRGGSVRSVAIYPSEYGKQRMAEEDRSGPQELTGRGKKWKGKEEEEDEDEEEEEEEENKRTMDLVDLDKLEKGKLDESVGATKRDFEALRRYQRNRLRYYYAVMECDTVDTARALYKECDRQPFEGAGILLDMRYIPSDMVFDETPQDLCRTVPQTYRAKSFVTTALQSTRPALTWDETDPDRAKTLGTAMAQALKGGSLDDDQLRDFLATSSEEEDEDERRAEEEEDDNSSDEDGNEDVKAARIAKFRALIQEIDAKERRRKEREIDMEDTLEEKEVEEEEEEGEQKEEEEKNSTKDTQLNPFEKYLEKRRAKKKEKRQKQKGKKMKGGTEENSDTDDDTISDDDLPEGMDDLYSDPFFAEELENRKKEKKRIKKKKDEDGEKEEEDDSTDKGNLELLLMEEEEEDKRHFNMREIIKSNEEDTRKKRRKKNLKKKMKEKQEEQKKKVDDFRVNISDPRFSELMTSGEYNIDPSHPQFKRTKAMDGLIGEIQRKRRVESGEVLPGAKRPHLEEETKRNLELTSLVQRVKRKTGKGKKPAKRNDHDTT